MTQTISRLLSDLDYERDGKQVSYLRAPISTNDSAYGTVLIPIIVVKNGRGPSVLATGGVHGDEYEGPIILSKLARELAPALIRGRIIILPALNLPAVEAGTRLSPLDGKNLNRTFPGERDGTITSAIAHYVDSVLFPLCDIVIDLHSGGRSLAYLPTVAMHYLEDRARTEATLAGLKAFGAPIGLIGRDLDDSGLLDYSAEAQGKITITTELGGAGMISNETLRIGETGVRNLLKHFALVEGEIVTPESQGRAPTRLVETPDLACFALAPEDGIYESFLELNEEVEAGASLGQVHFIGRPEREPEMVTAKRAGLLIARRAPGRVRRGDCIALLAVDCAGVLGPAF